MKSRRHDALFILNLHPDPASWHSLWYVEYVRNTGQRDQSFDYDPDDINTGGYIFSSRRVKQ